MLVEAADSPAPALPPADSPDTLITWLHLTDRCNLRCTYCFLPHQPSDLSFDTGRSILEAAFRSASYHGYPYVQIKYSGGEPTLRFPLIRKLHQHAQHLSAQSGLGCAEVILSNGVSLTGELAQEIAGLGINLMISLDELDEQPDSQRRFSDGRSAAPFARRSIETALQHGLYPQISVTVTNRSAADLPRLVEWLLQRDLSFGFNFYRENERSTAQTGLALDDQTIIRSILAAYQVIEANLPRQNLLAAILDRTNLAIPHLYPCGACRNYLVFDPRGSVARCHMRMEETFASAWDDDPLAVMTASSGGMQNPPVDEKEACRQCTWRHACAGGCPLRTHFSSGRYDQPSPYCAIYQALFPAALRLEGLRMLKYEKSSTL